MITNKEDCLLKVKKILEDVGINPSFQRIKILEFMINSKEHPNVEMIYNALYVDLPTLSKTTVYNTVKLLVEKGILISFSLGDGELRYDYYKEAHSHLYCIGCKKIIDCECCDLKKVIQENLDNLNFKFITAQFIISGYCKDCKNNKRGKKC